MSYIDLNTTGHSRRIQELENQVRDLNDRIYRIINAIADMHDSPNRNFDFLVRECKDMINEKNLTFSTIPMMTDSTIEDIEKKIDKTMHDIEFFVFNEIPYTDAFREMVVEVWHKQFEDVKTMVRTLDKDKSNE